MSASVTFRDGILNFTYQVQSKVVFNCACGWTGFSTELSSIDGFSCCPICNNFDVRIQN